MSPRWLTAEEIAAGRRYRSPDRASERYDAGIGYAERTLHDALAERIRRGWLVWQETANGGRVYALHLQGMQVSAGVAGGTGRADAAGMCVRYSLITAGGEIRLQVPFSHAAYYGRLPHVERVPSLEEELPALLHLADLQRDPRGRNGQELDLKAVEAALAEGLSAAALAARLGIGYERARRLYAAYHERETV